MFEATTHFNPDAFTHLVSEGEVMAPFSRPSGSQSYVLPCAGGKRIALLSQVFARRHRAEWCRRLEALDVPHAPMYDTDELPEDPQAKHLQLFVETSHPDPAVGGRWTTVRSPVSFDGERAVDVTAPPLLGDHNEALRSGGPVWRTTAKD